MALIPTASWTPNQEANLVGYRLYYRKSGDVYGPYFEVTAPLHSLQVTGLQKYTTYFFVITAFNSDPSNNESVQSVEVSTFISGGIILKF